jgi:hypothetical protein
MAISALRAPPSYGHTAVNNVSVSHMYTHTDTMHITFWTHSNPHSGIDSMQSAEYTAGIGIYR